MNKQWTMQKRYKLTLHWHKKFGYWWKRNGRETFYDKDDAWITFKTIDEAVNWAKSNAPIPVPREDCTPCS